MEVYEGDAREALDKLVSEVEKGERELFDFVFIDAAKSYYLEFWHKIRKMTKSGSVVVCDNTLMRGMTVDDAFDPKDKHRTNIRNMREFMDYITGLKDVHTSILPVGDGVTISYIKE
jgi:predicted O-methyltransferase YrrM